MQAHPSAIPTVSSRVERIVKKLSSHVKSKGITIKTRQGLTAFGEGLDDAGSVICIRSSVGRSPSRRRP
jgi:hypothetical protein